MNSKQSLRRAAIGRQVRVSRVHTSSASVLESSAWTRPLLRHLLPPRLKGPRLGWKKAPLQQVLQHRYSLTPGDRHASESMIGMRRNQQSVVPKEIDPLDPTLEGHLLYGTFALQKVVEVESWPGRHQTNVFSKYVYTGFGGAGRLAEPGHIAVGAQGALRVQRLEDGPDGAPVPPAGHRRGQAQEGPRGPP